MKAEIPIRIGYVRKGGLSVTNTVVKPDIIPFALKPD
jgi:hypothetical protein